MVVVEALPAFVVTGAGSDDANGSYLSTGKILFEAPIFENDQRCFLSRERHLDRRTGKMCYGWIIGQDRKPLYAAQSEDLMPPETGWGAFHGTFPLPQVQGMGDEAAAARAAAEAMKEQGNAFFASQKYEKAAAKWTRALGIVEGINADAIQIALYSNRAEARLRQQKWEKALDDATAALNLEPTHEKALLRAAVAAKEMRSHMQALDLVQQCLDAHPRQPQAVNMISELQEILRKERNTVVNKPSRLQEEWNNRDITEEHLARAFDAKDTNNKKGFKAFADYGHGKDGTVEKPPLSELPHNRYQVSPGQRQEADFSVQQMRYKAQEKKNSTAYQQNAYPWFKDVYKEGYMEDVFTGKSAPIDPQILPSEATRKAQELADEQNKGPPKPAPLKAEVLAPVAGVGKPTGGLGGQAVAEIDQMFSDFSEKSPPKTMPADGSSGSLKDRLEKAKSVMKEKGLLPAELKKDAKRKTGADSATAAGQSLADAVQRYQKARDDGDTKAVGAAEKALEKEFSTL